MRGGRRVAAALGLLQALEKSRRRNIVWARSLFSIYDSLDLIHLDLPWWTFRAIDALEAWLADAGRDARVFEYGTGASTVWLSRRCREVVSVEHHAPFADMMAPVLKAHPNVRLLAVPPAPAAAGQRRFRSRRQGYEQSSFEDYVSTIDRQDGRFDLIVIDGRARVACLEASCGRLSERGIVLFDNSDRAEYRQAIDDCPLTERVLRGRAPSLPMPSQTSLLLQKG